MRTLLWLGAGLLLGSIFGFAQDVPGEAGGQGRSARRPVILVPGWLGRYEDMIPLRERLIRDGWPEDEIFPMEFRDPVGSSIVHAAELEAVIDSALATSSARQVDVVAHSMGGLAVWVLLQEKGRTIPIHRVVFLATPFQGTVTAHLAWGGGGPEMIPGSDFLEGLQEGGWPHRWVSTLAIRTPLDLTVVPSDGATMLGARDRVICCPTHQGLLDHEETFGVIRDFLMYGRTSESPRPGP